MDRAVAILLAAILPALPHMAAAEAELSFYGGWTDGPDPDVTIDGGTGPALNFSAQWADRSASDLGSFGLRATWWQTDTLGFGVDLNRLSLSPDGQTTASSGFERLEFSDGLNILTVNAYRRWPDGFGPLSPYVGGGLGLAVPDLDLSEDGVATSGLQITGPAVAWIAGARYPLSDDLSVFGEYKGTYSTNETDLEGGGTLSSDILTTSINFGIALEF